MTYRLYLCIVACLLTGCVTPLPHNVTEPTYPFATDGCSASPDLDFAHCCIDHDKAYWRGGSCAERKVADRVFKECIAASGHRTLAKLYYSSVRLFGGPLLPTPWRWGFGWPYGMTYEEQSDCTAEAP